MRILVIGAGATGGFYGGKLALAGRDVTFLVRERRAAQLRQTGLVIRTPEGEQTLAPKLISAAQLASHPAFDLVLLGIKAYTLDAAIADFAPAVGPETMILPMQNGMLHLKRLAARFAPQNVLGGVCRIVGTMDAEGRVIQMTPLNELGYGELDGSLSPRIRAVDETMRNAGYDATLSDSIVQWMWEKWMLLSSLGSICVLGGGSIGAVAAVDDLEGAGLRLERGVLAEAISVASAYGHPPRQDWLAMMQHRLTESGSSLESSMYRDYTAGNPVEAWQIIGDLVRLARERDVPTPLLEAAFVRLRTYERARKP